MPTDSKFRTGLLCLLLTLVTLAVYWPVRSYEFTNFDDPDYVTENQMVQNGLSAKGVAWAIRDTHLGWHPITWLSHMLDYQLFGLNPGAHHFVNVLLHALNAVLLFLVFRRMTGAFWPSAFVAAAFALHPLNIEAVAWIAARKHVLSTLFWILTMWAYLHYAKGPAFGRYVVVVLLFILGLAAKPLVVTLPVVLLLLDFWPLRRWRVSLSLPPAGEAGETLPRFSERPFKQLILEKVPLLTLGLVVVMGALGAAHSEGVVRSAESYPLSARLGNAVVSYVLYLSNLIWPHDLAVLYPHPGFWPIWQVLGACVLLLLITGVVLMFLRRRPYLAVGWFWYLVTLLPMAGLVQWGVHSHADRYAYHSFIGLYLMVAWTVMDAVARWPKARRVAGPAFVGILVALTLATSAQLPAWRNSVTLFTRALAATTNNAVAHYNLGQALSQQQKLEESIVHYREAIRIRPDFAEAHNNLGLSLAMSGDFEGATNHYQIALQLLPKQPDFHFNHGALLVRMGNVDQGVEHLRSASQLNPENYLAHGQLGIALALQNKPAEAESSLRRALQIEPKYPDGRFYLGKLLLDTGRAAEAVSEFRTLTTLRPESPAAQAQLASAFLALQKPDEAIQHYREALRLNPDAVDVLNNLAWLLATHPDAKYRNGAEAVSLAEHAVEVSGKQQPVFLGTLAAAYAEAGRFDSAVTTGLEAEQLARSLGQTDTAKQNQDLLEFYRAGKPFRAPAP